MSGDIKSELVSGCLDTGADKGTELYHLGTEQLVEISESLLQRAVWVSWGQDRRLELHERRRAVWFGRITYRLPNVDEWIEKGTYGFITCTLITVSAEKGLRKSSWEMVTAS